MVCIITSSRSTVLKFLVGLLKFLLANFSTHEWGNFTAAVGANCCLGGTFWAFFDKSAHHTLVLGSNTSFVCLVLVHQSSRLHLSPGTVLCSLAILTKYMECCSLGSLSFILVFYLRCSCWLNSGLVVHHAIRSVRYTQSFANFSQYAVCIMTSSLGKHRH